MGLRLLQPRFIAVNCAAFNCQLKLDIFVPVIDLAILQMLASIAF